MVDSAEVYLEIKINYFSKSETIETNRMLSVNEIKEIIIKKFSYGKFNKENIELYNAKNGKQISDSDDIFFLAEEKSENRYFFEIKLRNKDDEKREILLREQNEIKENNKKINNLKVEIKKYEALIEHQKKVNEINKKIKIYKAYNEIKNNLIKEIMPIIQGKMNECYNEVDNNLENIKNKIDNNINIKGEQLKEIINKQLEELVNQIKQKIENIEEQNQ